MELSVSPGLRVGEKEGPRSPVCILPVYEQSQAKGRGHLWHRSEDKNNPRDRLGSRLSRSRGRVRQCYANRPELSNGQLTSKHLAAAAFPGKRPPLTARAESARAVGEYSHAAIPNSFSLATKYSCGRSPLTRLQWAHSSCRFSMRRSHARAKIDPAHQLGRSRADCREDCIDGRQIAHTCQVSCRI